MTTPAKKPHLKNAYAETTVEESIAIIRKALTAHKARRLSFDYDEEGDPTALSFELEINKRRLSFRLPVRMDIVEQKVLEAYPRYAQVTDRLREQAHRTAWANIKDWVLAQLALIDSNMVKLEEVFMPYLLDKEGHTYFEAFEERLALPAPPDDSVTGSYVVIQED